jgi:hypothetical protein
VPSLRTWGAIPAVLHTSSWRDITAALNYIKPNTDVIQNLIKFRLINIKLS